MKNETYGPRGNLIKIDSPCPMKCGFDYLLKNTDDGSMKCNNANCEYFSRINNSEFIDVEWFDTGNTGLPSQTIGIVLMYNEHAGFKCYMGIGSGVSAPDDMEYIYKHGQKINHQLAFAVWSKRMRAEWITRHLNEDLINYKYDDSEYALEKAR